MIHFVSNQAASIDSDLYVTSTLKECVEYCSDKQVLGVDTETTGLSFIDKKVIMFQIGDEDHQFVIDTRGLSIEPLRKILEDPGIVKIFHNAKFDINHIRSSFGIVTTGIYDTFLTEMVMYNGKKMRYGLTHLTDRYLGVSLDKEERNKFIGLSGQPYTDRQIDYGAKDVEYLIQIRKMQMEKWKTQPYKQTVILENSVVEAFAEVEWNGMKLDETKWLKNASETSNEMHEQELKLDALVLAEPETFHSVVPKMIQGDLFTDDVRRINIQWSSPKQALEVFQCLYEWLPSVGAPLLNTIRNPHPILKEYLHYKELQKRVGSYGVNFLKHKHGDGLIHTAFRQILNTGRVSSSEPNMQQLPGTKQYRSCFIPQQEGWKFVSSDYSSQELCVIATMSQDPVWMRALKEGKDLHSICAELIFGDRWKSASQEACDFYKADEKGEAIQQKCECPEHKSLRTFAKTINFG